MDVIVCVCVCVCERVRWACIIKLHLTETNSTKHFEAGSTSPLQIPEASVQTNTGFANGETDAPRLAEPVAHDGHDAGPDGRLQEAVHHPQGTVQVDVVDLEPLGERAKHELLQNTRGGDGFKTFDKQSESGTTGSPSRSLTTVAEPHRPKQST